MKADKHCYSRREQERATSAAVRSSKTGLLSSPFHSQKAAGKTCRPLRQLPQKQNTSGTVASWERNKVESLSSCFILFAFSKSHASTSN